MTIALGLLARDGVILAADTEETNGFLRTSQSKISTAVYESIRQPVFSSCACGISGAGSAAHIDLLTEDLSGVFLDNALPFNGQPRRALAKCVDEFHHTHIIPFAAYPIQDRPSLSMLVALSLGPQQALLASEMTTLRKVGPHAAVGAGAMFAQVLLQRLWRPGLDTRTAALLAAYVVWLTKDSVPDCGKMTEILVLSQGTGGYVSWQDSHAIETTFERVSALQHHAFHHAIGSITDDGSIMRSAEELRVECDGFTRNLVPIQTFAFKTRGKDGVSADNWKIDMTRAESPKPPTRRPKRRRS